MALVTALAYARHAPTPCEDVYARLHARAAAEHRSIAQETIVLLRSALSVPQSRKDLRRALLERIRNRDVAEPIPALSSEAMIREDRDR